MWAKFQAFFEVACIARKCCNEVKDQSNESMNKITKAKLSMYPKAIKMKTTQENKECNEHIQQVMEQNATLINLVQYQQKKIEELMKQNKELLGATSKGKQENNSNGGTTRQTRDNNK